MTQAQKVAKEKFKKAIEYRKKFGVSLKEAFAKVYNNKGVQKVAKKVKSGIKKVKRSAKREITLYKKRKVEAKKKACKSLVGSVKKKSAPKKKISEQSILNKIHVVKKGVEKLDEAQHKHMLGAVNKNLISDLNQTTDKIHQTEVMIYSYQQRIKLLPKNDPNIKEKLKYYKITIFMFKKMLKEYKAHLSEIKKLIK